LDSLCGNRFFSGSGCGSINGVVVNGGGAVSLRYVNELEWRRVCGELDSGSIGNEMAVEINGVAIGELMFLVRIHRLLVNWKIIDVEGVEGSAEGGEDDGGGSLLLRRRGYR